MHGPNKERRIKIANQSESGLKGDNSSSVASHAASYYAASAGAIPERATLVDSISTDVCIVGGGYTGVSCALHLAKRGYSVVVLEANKIAWGASGRNGGHVGTGQRVEQPDLEKRLGLTHAKALWSLSLEAVELVKSLIAEFQIDCDLKSGILHLADKAREIDDFIAEAKHQQGVYNYSHLRFVGKTEVNEMIGSPDFHGGLLDTNSAHLHPLKYALGLAFAAERLGVQLYENSRVTSMEVGATNTLQTKFGEVQASYTVLACNGYIDKLEAKITRHIMPINNFMLATEPLEQDVAKQLIRDDVAVTDSLFVINYWKLSADNRLLFGGGETYTSRFPSDIKSFVRKYMLKIYPQLEDVAIEYGWGGTLAITLKRMPHYGTLAPNVFFAHGYSGHGVPTATLAGKLLAEAIDGDRTRFDLMATVPCPIFPGGTLLRWPALVAGMSYYALRDRF